MHDRRHPPASAIAVINDILQTAPGTQQLIRVGGEWRIHFALAIAPDALGAIARSAAGTLSEPLVAVRQCAGADCFRFLADDSVGQSRRWCAETCSNGAWVERRRGALR
jgi:predicted RNA-binding Zn ribbon-like protein